MAVSNQEVLNYLTSSPNLSDADIYSFMQQKGVSASQMSNATGLPLADVISRVQTVAPQNTLGGVILAGDSWLSGDEKTALANTAFGQPVTNTAIGGQKTSDVLNQLNQFENNGGTFASGSTVVLDIGGNDLATGVNRNTIRSNINEIVSRLDNYGVNVILSGAPSASSYSEAISSTNLVMDDLYNDIAKTNKNVIVVDAMSGLLNQKNLMDESGFHLKDDASKLQFLNQLASAYTGEAPPLVTQAVSNNLANTQNVANPVVAQSLSTQVKDWPTINYATYGTDGDIETRTTTSDGTPFYLRDEEGGGMYQNPATVESYAPFTGADGKTYYAIYAPTFSSGKEWNETPITGTMTEEQFRAFQGGTTLGDAIASVANSPVGLFATGVLAGPLGTSLGLTGSAAPAVGMGLLKGGTALAGGASVEDALATGLLSGGLVYGGNALNNYLTTGSTADVGLTERQFAIQDATQLANQGLTATQIKDTLSVGGYNDAIIERALNAITTIPTVASTQATDGVTITSQAPTSLNNVINTIASTTPAVTITAPKTTQMTTQEILNLVNSQIAANVTTPTNLANVQVTAPKTTTTQDVISTIASTLPALTTTPTQTITAPSNTVTTQNLINTIAATLPTLNTGTNTPAITTTTPEIATQTITAKTPPKIGDALAAITTIPSTLTTTPVTSTTTTTADKTKETDPLRVAQLALAAAGLLGAGSALSNTGTGTQFPIVPIPEGWRTPPPTGVAPFTPLPAINFGDRNLLIGTQWEKFLDPNYGKVPAPVQYSQPSSLSYNDLMGILGSRQGMPPASSLSINDIISGIQNQYGQAPARTMG
jgi:hypothetical protein